MFVHNCVYFRVEHSWRCNALDVLFEQPRCSLNYPFFIFLAFVSGLGQAKLLQNGVYGSFQTISICSTNDLSNY